MLREATMTGTCGAVVDPAVLSARISNTFSGARSRGAEMESFRLLFDQLRTLSMVVRWMMACFARLVLVFLPKPFPLHGLTSVLETLSYHGGESFPRRAVEKRDGSFRSVKLNSSGIGRALSQVLALVNDIPASSNKYAFARSLAERIIQENKAHSLAYESVNRAALGVGFARTVKLLSRSLEGLQQDRGNWIWRLLRLIPFMGVLPYLALPMPLARVRSLVGQILSPMVNSQISGPKGVMVMSTTNVTDTEIAEKLAQELLWMAEKLSDCGAMEFTFQQWSSESSLAELSLYATPRVQKSLVRLCALLFREIVSDTETPDEVKFKLLRLWLPLFCFATHGGDGPIFNSAEKSEAECSLERVVLSLPDSDKEMILSIWLQEYAMSESDWPNLQNCYYLWCHSTRKLENE